MGTVEVGKLADTLLIDGDFSTDVPDLADCREPSLTVNECPLWLPNPDGRLGRSSDRTAHIADGRV